MKSQLLKTQFSGKLPTMNSSKAPAASWKVANSGTSEENTATPMEQNMRYSIPTQIARWMNLSAVACKVPVMTRIRGCAWSFINIRKISNTKRAAFHIAKVSAAAALFSRFSWTSKKACILLATCSLLSSQGISASSSTMSSIVLSWFNMEGVLATRTPARTIGTTISLKSMRLRVVRTARLSSSSFHAACQKRKPAWAIVTISTPRRPKASAAMGIQSALFPTEMCFSEKLAVGFAPVNLNVTCRLVMVSSRGR
mmetsp:Transcript_51068/g.154603  ORF Transcript_51068/g.154603 Transcript_51068/m.154603 type:complete len:255 (+) Transcript_51068:53-817(+)